MCTCRVCYHAVLARTSFDVLRHPLSFCCSLLRSLCPQCHRGHYPLSLVLHLSCPRGFSLCVPSLCSPPAQVLRSLQSPPHSDWLSLRLPFAFLSLSRRCVKKAATLLKQAATFPNMPLCYALTLGMPPQCYQRSAVQPGDKH